MKIEDYIKVIAGSFVFLSAFLGFFYSRWWLLFTMFVGLNLFQYGFTGFCPMAKIIDRVIT